MSLDQVDIEVGAGRAVVLLLRQRQTGGRAAAAVRRPHAPPPPPLRLQILRRSGTEHQKRLAQRISPLLRRPHVLLVTLLVINALAAEALPLVLDRLADPATAIVVSVTVVLLFGEIIPQAACSRYGLQIGAYSAPFVQVRLRAGRGRWRAPRPGGGPALLVNSSMCPARPARPARPAPQALIFLTAPVSFPIGWLLDWVLGSRHTALFRRAELKALVDIHREGQEFGGHLSAGAAVGRRVGAGAGLGRAS